MTEETDFITQAFPIDKEVIFDERLKTSVKRPNAPKPIPCAFCKPQPFRPVLDPTNVHLLSLFMTPAGNILPRRIVGNCSKHQRRLARTIKRAKHLGLFSYKDRRFTIVSPFHPPEDKDAKFIADLMYCHLSAIKDAVDKSQREGTAFDWEIIERAIPQEELDPK
eukprot:TRINITY_DN7687_c0_g1_i1.p1 TRINITY_DN7687_c0_g1~~TRINITY_DN7687_c0_g1_i1.p1  ORF type:complete len:165 (-),score=31.60 TRINITY_DN7687_c0_g1_i1:72-566(-)